MIERLENDKMREGHFSASYDICSEALHFLLRRDIDVGKDVLVESAPQRRLSNTRIVELPL